MKKSLGKRIRRTTAAAGIAAGVFKAFKTYWKKKKSAGEKNEEYIPAASPEVFITGAGGHVGKSVSQ